RREGHRPREGSIGRPRRPWRRPVQRSHSLSSHAEPPRPGSLSSRSIVACKLQVTGGARKVQLKSAGGRAMASVAEEFSKTVADVAAKVAPSVVAVGAGGSGVVVGKGLVVTSAHNIRRDGGGV